MATKRKGKLDWNDELFHSKLMQVSAERQINFKEFRPSDKSFREMTRLIPTCPSWPKLERELKTMPKRRRNE